MEIHQDPKHIEILKSLRTQAYYSTSLWVSKLDILIKNQGQQSSDVLLE